MPTCLATEPGFAIDAVAITPGHVGFCVGDDAKRSCWDVELGTGTYVPRPATPRLDDPGTPPNATLLADGSIKLCPARSKPTCTSWKPPQPLGEGDLAVSDDGQLVAHVSSGSTAVELYDVATGKRRATIKAWNTDMGAVVDLPTFAGDDCVIVWGHATPVSDAGRIFTRDGKLIGKLGPDSFTQDSLDSWPIAGSVWAFKQLDSPAFRIVDVGTGKLVRELQLDVLRSATGDDRAEVAGVMVEGNTIVYVTQLGHVGLIDRTTWAIKALAPPACK